MKEDKFDVIATLLKSIRYRMKSLRSSYLSEELGGYLDDIESMEWQSRCQMERYDKGYRLIDPSSYNATCAQVLDNGDVYVGGFNEQHCREGRGIYIYEAGSVLSCNWVNGSNIGEGYRESATGQHGKFYSTVSAPAEPLVYNRSNSFWERLVHDKVIGRLDFLLGNILLALPVAVLVNLLPPVYWNFIFLGAFVFWLILYIKRCRDCRFNFFIGLLLLIISPLTLLVYIWPGKYVSAPSVPPFAGAGSQSVPTSKPTVPFRSQANIPDAVRDLNNPSGQHTEAPDAGRNLLDGNKRDRQQEQDDAYARKKQAEENERRKIIDDYKSSYENAMRNYENAMSEAERAFTQAQTERSYAEDEERKARDYDDESAMSRAREYIDKYNMYMDDANKAKQAAEGYKYEMEIYRNRLALLNEFI